MMIRLALLALAFTALASASRPHQPGYPQPTPPSYPVYRPPTPTYHAPPPPPPPKYHAPAPTYHPAPTPSYHQPAKQQPVYHDNGYNSAGHATVTYRELPADRYEQPSYHAPPPPSYGYQPTKSYEQPKETYHPAKKVQVDTNIQYYAPILKKTGYGYNAQVHKVGEAAVRQYQSLTTTHGGGYVSEKPGYGGYKTEEHYVNSKPEYKFGYDIDGGYTKISAHEKREGYVTKGSYSFKQPDGLTRIVDYYVDKWGFHPTVRFVRHH